MKRKFMLCQYPKNGFGGKCGKYYLLDMYGNMYDIENEYDKVLGEMELVVRINDSPNGVIHERTCYWSFGKYNCFFCVVFTFKTIQF